MKSPRQLERYFKGAANHRRIAILLAVERSEGIGVQGLADTLKANLKTISQHTRALVQAGFLRKTYQGRAVAHSLSPYGKLFLAFLRKF